MITATDITDRLHEFTLLGGGPPSRQLARLLADARDEIIGLRAEVATMRRIAEAPVDRADAADTCPVCDRPDGRGMHLDKRPLDLDPDSTDISMCRGRAVAHYDHETRQG